jgi:hypothetical protein
MALVTERWITRNPPARSTVMKQISVLAERLGGSMQMSRWDALQNRGRARSDRCSADYLHGPGPAVLRDGHRPQYFAISRPWDRHSRITSKRLVN